MPYFFLALNYLLMVSVPLILGWFIARRRQISWRYFGIGAATFILAQVFHIPFNYLALNYWLPRLTLPSEAAMFILSAAFLGLSAAVFEGGARYLAYRFWAKDARTWGRGLVMGAGHGGAESILLGLGRAQLLHPRRLSGRILPGTYSTGAGAVSS